MTLLQELAVETGIGGAELGLIVLTAPKRYKQYYIPKRNGGQRLIAQPAKELKILQRALLDRLIEAFPVHPAAAAYVKGRNIRENAELHRQSRVIGKLDFREFFPSIKASDWLVFLDRVGAERASKLGVNTARDRWVTLQLLFWGQGSYVPACLSIGAPTSPTISNLVLFEFDRDATDACNGLGVSYSRYADDITLSGASTDKVRAAEEVIRSAVARLAAPKLTFNEEKRGIYTSGQKRMVTGLVITPDSKVSLGRARKREIHSLVHKFSKGLLVENDIARTKGMVGFANAVEPTFLSRLREKYGSEVLDAILKFHVRRRVTRVGFGVTE